MISHTIAITLALMTWYGGGFIGEHHSAYWHHEVPPCAPDVVDEEYFGVAASTDFSFGTVLRFTRLDTGATAYGVVMDRRARYTPEYTKYFDAWPALAQLLGFGPTFGQQDPGVIRVRVERVWHVRPTYLRDTTASTESTRTGGHRQAG